MAVSARKRVWGWFFFDWASQPFSTLLLTFIFGPYFAEVAVAHYTSAGLDPRAAGAAAQSYWGAGQTVAGVAIAVFAPIVGALADGSGRKLVWIWFFSLCYVLGSFGLWFLMPDQPDLFRAMAWFGLGMIGMEFATIFTNALLPDLGAREEIGRISGSGFAFGYLGGIFALVLMLAFFAENGASGKTLLGLDPILGLDASLREGTRAVGPFTAVWYVVFMVPFFLWVRVPRSTGQAGGIRGSARDLLRLFAGLAKRRSLAAFLGSSMLYRDALNGLFGFGGIYASGVLGWSVTDVGIFGIVGALAGMTASWLGGRADSKLGPKPVIVASILILILVCIVVVGMSRDALFGVPFAAGSTAPDKIFYLCGALIGGAGGTIQAASRTLMVFHAAPNRATEAFGLYALSGKATAFIAPAMITVATTISGSQQIGIMPVVFLFIIGMILLIWVDPKGERHT